MSLEVDGLDTPGSWRQMPGQTPPIWKLCEIYSPRFKIIWTIYIMHLFNAFNQMILSECSTSRSISLKSMCPLALRTAARPPSKGCPWTAVGRWPGTLSPHFATSEDVKSHKSTFLKHTVWYCSHKHNGASISDHFQPGRPKPPRLSEPSEITEEIDLHELHKVYLHIHALCQVNVGPLSHTLCYSLC